MTTSVCPESLNLLRPEPVGHSRALVSACALGLCLAFGLGAGTVNAQVHSNTQASSPAAVSAAAAADAPDAAYVAESTEAAEDTGTHLATPVPIGQATRQLLALQREGTMASPVARPIPGQVAQRSQDRYLKSFEHPIPERFQSSVLTQKAGGGKD